MDLRQVNTEYGEFLHLREQQLNGPELSMGEWEADLKVREKRLHNAEVNMEGAEDRRYQVSLSYCRIV